MFDTLSSGVWILFSSSWLNELWMGERSRGGWAPHEVDKVTAPAIYCRSMDLDFYQPDFTMESVEFFGEAKAKKAFRVASMRLPKVSRWPRFRSTLLSFITFTDTLYEWKLRGGDLGIVQKQYRTILFLKCNGVKWIQMLYTESLKHTMPECLFFAEWRWGLHFLSVWHDRRAEFHWWFVVYATARSLDQTWCCLFSG